MQQPITTPAREIAYDAETRDFALYIAGELVGFARSYANGERVIDEILAERGKRGKLAADEAPRCELCDGPAVLVGEQLTCPECCPIGDEAPPVVGAEHPAGFTPLPILAPESIANQTGRRFDLVQQHADGSATYRAHRARATLSLSNYAVRLMAEGVGVTIEELVDPRTGRTRLFSYRAA